MVIRCVAVVKLAKSEYSRERMYAPAVFVAYPDDEGEYEWCLAGFYGPVFDQLALAVADAVPRAESRQLPFIRLVEHGETVVYSKYKAACEAVPVECDMRPPTFGAVPAGDEKGAV